MGSCKFFEAKGRHGLDSKEVFFPRYIIIILSTYLFLHMVRELCVCVCVYMTSHVLNCGWLKKQPQLA